MNRKLSYQQLEQKIQKIEKNLFDLKNKEKELEEHREKLQLAMKAANYFSFEINLKSLKITASEEIYENLDYPKKERASLIHNAGSLIHPDDYEKMKAHILSDGKNRPLAFNFEFRIKHNNQQWTLFMATGKNTEWDEEGNPLRIVGLLKNIQQDKENQQKFKESEEKFKDLATLLPEVVYETDRQGNLTFINLKAYEIFGYTPEDFKKGLHALQMIAPEHIFRARENIKKNFENKIENSKGIEYMAITKKGKRFPVLVYSNPILQNNKIKGLRGIIVNISAQKNLIEKLKRSEKNFHQLTNNINDAFWLRHSTKKLFI